MKENYHKDNLKENILCLTTEMVKKQGYQAVSIRKISKELEVSPTAIYRHYHNLEDLFEKVLILLSKEFTIFLGTGYEPKELIQSSDEIKIVGCNFVNFSVVHKNEFEFLFLSEYSLKNVSLRTDFQAIPLLGFMKLVMERYNHLNSSIVDIETVFNQLWCFIFGYAVLVSKNQLEFDEEFIKITLKKILV